MAKAITDATMGAGNGAAVEVDASKVSVVTSEITADEFLLILAEEVLEYPMGNGTHAVLRSLSRPDVLRLLKEYKNNQDDLAFGAVRMAMIKPELTAEQWEMAAKGKAGPLMKMGKAVMQQSGMIDDDVAMGEDGASS